MAFQTSLSGMNAAQANLDVTGNNIANASTHGFKRSRALFSDVYAQSYLGSTSTEIGDGVRLAEVQQQFTQGNVEFTDNNLDLAVSGEGFYVLKDTDGSPLYTRAGAFHVDREGYVVNSHDQRLQKYDVNANGVVTNRTPSDLWIDTAANPASATTEVDLGVNLDSTASIIAPSGALGIDPADATTYNFSTSTTIYDSLGETHTATIYFRKDSLGPPIQWQAALEIDGGGILTPVPEMLTFDSAGALSSATPVDLLGGVPYNAGNGSAPFNNLWFDFTGTSQYGGDSHVNTVVQDGYTVGRLSGVDVDLNGLVFAKYTNGQSVSLGSVALAKFANPHALRQVGETNWAATFESGDVVPGQANTGSFGAIHSGALESANVDLSKELVEMIVAQRDFQANAKMISTENEITQTIINIR